MSHSILDQAKFWEIVKYLVQLEEGMSFKKICEDLSIQKHQLLAFISFLKEVSYDLDYHAGPDLIIPPKVKPTMSIEFSLLEWLQFQAHFPSLSKEEGRPYFEEFKAKLYEMEDKFSRHDLFSSLEGLASKNNFLDFELVKSPAGAYNHFNGFLNEVIEDGQVIQLKLADKFMSVYPHNLVHIEGELSLIAESLIDKCLMLIEVSEIEQMYELEKDYNPIFTLFDVSEFIQKMRLIGEGEERLILKILDPVHFKTENTNEFFMNPCLVMTPRGESIWAATIEKSPTLFEWLYQMSPFIEIIDPIGLKKEFLDYCEKKYKREA